MSKGWVIFFIVLGIALVAGIIWYYNRKSSNKKVSIPGQIKVEDNKEEEAVEVGKEEEKGETIPSLHSQNYKGIANDIFYLSYVNEGGKSEIEEVSKEKYDQFIKDYPSGIAQGNVIKKYL